MELFSRIEEKREYARELQAAFDHIGEDLYPMLEKAEAQDKKIVVKYGNGIDQIDSITIE
nr:hypothetical protein [Parabacteroides goldsteinii]